MPAVPDPTNRVFLMLLNHLQELVLSSNKYLKLTLKMSKNDASKLIKYEKWEYGSFVQT